MIVFGTKVRASLMLCGMVVFALHSDPLQRLSETRVLEGTVGALQFALVKTGEKWGLAVTGVGLASIQQAEPVGLEFYEKSGAISKLTAAYDRFDQLTPGVALAVTHLAGPGKSRFVVEDRWTVKGSTLQLSRKVLVSGNADAGFMSSVSLSHPDIQLRPQVDYFAPGMIYGGPEHLSAGSIGASDTYGAGGHGNVQIREDRLPAPMLGVHFKDGSALTVLDPAPQGDTTKADSFDTVVKTLIDEKFLFGALAAHLSAGHNEQGFWYPGSEGEVTYSGNTYPGGQVHKWRRRYHPVRDGTAQQYTVLFRFSTKENFPSYYRNAWRWAYGQLRPPITWQNLPQIRRSIVAVLASQVQTVGGRFGIPNFVSAAPNSNRRADPKAIMGFTGKNLESAEFLLADSLIDSDQRRAEFHRKLGLRIFSFISPSQDEPSGG